MMISKFTTGASALALAILSGAAAQAGGVVAPVFEAEPVTVAAPVATAWDGAYAGGSLGYVFGTDDEVGIRVFEGGEITGTDNELGDLGISGLTGGLQAGYRWQRGNWVYGPELSVEFGSVDESRTISPFGVDLTAENELNHLVALVAKVGYLVSPETLVYGTLGGARGDYDYSLSDGTETLTEGYSVSGLVAGMGVERMVSERVSIFGEYQYRDFGNELVVFGDTDEGLGTQASLSQSSIKIGANWNF